MSHLLRRPASMSDDPPAVGGIVFGASAPQAFAFSASQITASHSQPPKYRWDLGNNPTVATVGPDGNLYSVKQTGTLGIQRHELRANGCTNYLITNAGGFNPGGFSIAFFAQAPAAGLDPWTAFVMGVSGSRGLRYNAACMQGLTNPEKATPDVFTSMSNPNSHAFDAAGKIWAVAGTTAVRFAAPTGAAGAATTEITLTTSGNAQDVAINAAGDLLISRYTANGADCRRWAAATVAGMAGAVSTAPTAIYTATTLSGWGYLRFDHNGNLWAASYNTPRICRFPVASVTGATATINPDIVLDGAGLLGDGNATGPSGLFMFPGFGPVR